MSIYLFDCSQGYLAPYILDEDLHIEPSGSRQVINVNDPNGVEARKGIEY